MESLLFVHSPLLGPSSWKPVASIAKKHGRMAAVPDLTTVAALPADWSSAFVELAAAACPTDGDVTLVGHSGAGTYLPSIARTVGMGRVSFVFVDSVVPPASGTLIPGDRISDLLNSHTEDGVLLPWLDWWPEAVLDVVLPSRIDRATLRADMPRLPRALYSETLIVPEDWALRPCRYVRTSKAYEAEHRDAVERGWQHSLIEGTHLTLFTDPETLIRAHPPADVTPVRVAAKNDRSQVSTSHRFGDMLPMVVTSGSGMSRQRSSGMIKTPRSGETAERFVAATLQLIEEQGGSQSVNLREVARRVGIAHTNVYHYFDGLPGLTWEALRRAVAIYGEALTSGLRDDMSPFEYFSKFVENMVAFPQERPGLHRFIGSDPIAGGIPQDIVATVGVLKQWADDVVHACAPGVSPEVAADTCNIIVAYIGGDSLDLINGRFLPGEDLSGRMVDYSLRLFTLLTGFDGTSVVEPQDYPQLILT